MRRISDAPDIPVPGAQRLETAVGPQAPAFFIRRVRRAALS